MNKSGKLSSFIAFSRLLFLPSSPVQLLGLLQAALD
jgi:hypothetical protein